MRTDPFREFDEVWERNREMNERIRRSLRREPRSNSEPEAKPETPAGTIDLGAGARPIPRTSDPGKAFQRWLWQQHHRQRTESVDVNMKRSKP
jgi:hypothetical protein